MGKILLPLGGRSSHFYGTLCGDIVELTYFAERLQTGAVCEGKKPQTPPSEDEGEDYIESSVRRSQKTIRRLCNTNRLYYFHTLTFADKHPEYFKGEKPFILVPNEEQKDRDKCIELWRKFARKMRKYAEKKNLYFRYIAVIERHTGARCKEDYSIKKGCYHVHFVSDRIWSKRLLQAKWRHGLCNYSDWTKGRKSRDLAENDDLPAPDNPGAYMSKYMSKDAEKAEPGRKRYWRSTNLNNPISITGREYLELMKKHGETKLWERITEHETDEGNPRVSCQWTFKLGGGQEKDRGRKLRATPKSEAKRARINHAIARLSIKYHQQLKTEIEQGKDFDESEYSESTKRIDKKYMLEQVSKREASSFTMERGRNNRACCAND